MSKIFEALKRAGGETAGMALPLLDHRGADFSPQPDFSPAASAIRTLPIQAPADTPVLPFDGTHARAAEQYRIVRTRIVQHPEQPRILVVSSATARDGKTVSAINLSGVLALKNDANVLLVDADFRRSNIAELLGLPVQPGLADVLRGDCALEDVIIRVEQFPNLYVAPGGRLQNNGTRYNPAELLDSPRWKTASAAFRKEFRFTIVDAPPIGAVADYDLIQAVCDGVIIVVRPDHTNRTLCLQALQAVPQAKRIGVLMNCNEEWFLRKSHDYYYCSSAEGPQNEV